MLSTLRRRLTLSHMLPVLLIVPLLGIAFLYISQPRSSAASLSHETFFGLQAILASLEYRLVTVVGLGLLLGVLIGWSLAVEMERPLGMLTQFIRSMKDDKVLRPHPVHGPQEIRELAGAIYELAERRYDLEQERRKLLANLVHEFGRSLGALSTAVHACNHGAWEEREMRQRLLDGMETELLGMKRLLDDLSHLRDQVIGDFNLSKWETHLERWLYQVLHLWQEVAEKKGLDWELDIPADLPRVHFDPDRLNQALGNLVANAVKFTPPGGKVRILARLTPDAVGIRVSDSGPGIPEEELEQIFIPFYRGTPLGEPTEGMGLGLSIARDLVEAHDGRLEVETDINQGSHFTIWLPLSDAQIAAPVRSTLGIRATAGNGAEIPVTASRQI
jgi:two-component system sensor histidine kinase BaeS